MSRLSVFSALLLAGCMSISAQAKERLTAEGTTPDSSNLISLITLGELASNAGVADFQILDGQTLTLSFQNVAEGKTDIAGAPLLAPFLMSRGIGPYANLGAEKGAELAKNVEVLFTVSFGITSLYSYDTSSVHGWEDLAGKKILNGPPGGGALTQDRGIIQLVTGLEDGKGYQGIQSDWSQMDKTITDGSADAVMIPGALPDPRMARVSAAGAMTMYSVPKAAYESGPFQNFLKSPGIAGFELKVDEFPRVENITIHSEDGIWRSPMATGAIVVNKNMDFELAKKLTALMIANVKKFEEKAPLMRYVLLGEIDPAKTGMCGGVPIKYHPGAVAAWEEAGFKVPDCVK